MTQAAKKKEDTRSVKLIKAQSNQVQQLLAEKEALGEKLGKKEEEIAILRKMPHLHVLLQKNRIGSMTMVFLQSVMRRTIWRDEESDQE